MRTPLCDLVGIDAPIVQASIGPWSSPELTAAACEAGALGSLGTALRTPQEIAGQIERVRELTDRPFAVNHTARPFDPEAWRVTLEARPRVVSFAIGHPGELVEQAHQAGCLFIHQVHTVAQAEQSAKAGVDVLIAQGGEAGGFGDSVSTMALVPQVVDAVGPLPVVAVGGIADGRGLAAALVLGAQGVNIGTRFLASSEAHVDGRWQEAIVRAASEDAVKVEFAGSVFPPVAAGGYDTLPRSLRTAFVDRWNERPADAARESERLGTELVDAVRAGRGHELVPFTGQSAGLIREVRSAGEIVRDIVAEAEAALRDAAS
jgi:nitronate monooxygenase/enoyl-[acyl-carrier protein] reductase II